MTKLNVVESRIRGKIQVKAADLPSYRDALEELDSALAKFEFVTADVVADRGHKLVGCIYTPALRGGQYAKPLSPAITFKSAAVSVGFETSVKPTANPVFGEFYNKDVREGLLQVMYSPVVGAYSYVVQK